ncbi:MAG: recombination protein RecR [Solobacterium sp.]|nr:recombination protein RecR [Solobacterium sp.]MBR2685615.1 recombination protein RecR [Erysipelotrichaceae bacterium]
MYPKSLQQLIEKFKMLPGVGEKTAERYALMIMNLEKEEVEQFSNALMEVKTKIHKCSCCGNLTENDLCDICSDPQRDKGVICVVQDAKDILALERMREYRGVYHVLGGVISTNKGILPSDLNIKTLTDRVNENTKEVIVATNPTLEGETTALYLAKILGEKTNVTRLAHGLPMGGHLDYTDELTLSKAMENRHKI